MGREGDDRCPSFWTRRFCLSLGILLIGSGLSLPKTKGQSWPLNRIAFLIRLQCGLLNPLVPGAEFQQPL